ncbi:restriction endonuclease [Bacillus nitratireducens]|uniref:restriction endonuclease n=1 Tax=Bacillus nitratireducens TaxID=2026193 RepID=UPI00387A432E
MSQVMETIYNEFIADEKLKNGTKYERLAAVVFKTLNTTDVVIHNLRLRGDGKKTPHQIDVIIERDNVSKRVLIECKDYDTEVGISIIRDFFGAVSQIKPDESFVVTTKGYTRGAKSFAEEEGIKLAILREFKDDDWAGRCRFKNQNYDFVSINPGITWVAASQEDRDNFNANANKDEINSVQGTNTVDNFFYDRQGNRQDHRHLVLLPIFCSFIENTNSPTTGRYEFESTKYIKIAGVLVGIKGFHYEYSTTESVKEVLIDAGEQVALLLFKVIDGSIDKIIFQQDLDKWAFNDDGEVISKGSV